MDLICEQRENEAPVGKSGGDMEESSEQESKKPRLDEPMCQECDKSVSKYSCPKCGIRTCSLVCSKGHKETKKCDGVRPKWNPVPHQSKYNAKHSTQDKHFLNTMKYAFNNLSHLSLPPALANCLNADSDEEDKPNDELTKVLDLVFDEDNVKMADENVGKCGHSLSYAERTLKKNCTDRRIWLDVKDSESVDGSHFEQNSETIFWTMTLKFLRQPKRNTTGHRIDPAGTVVVDILNTDVVPSDEGELSADEEPLVISEEKKSNTIAEESSGEVEENGEVDEFEHTVKNIPETLTVSTLLRQFLKPKIAGPIVSVSDLQMDKMKPFIEAGIDGVIVYMKVPYGDGDRYYLVDPTKPILDNLRNRFVSGHPFLLVTLNNEFNDFEILTEEESRHLQDLRRTEMGQQNEHKSRHQNSRGSHQRDFHRRGGQNRGGHQFRPQNQRFERQPRNGSHPNPNAAQNPGVMNASRHGQAPIAGPSQNMPQSSRGPYDGQNQRGFQRRNDHGGNNRGPFWGNRGHNNRGGFNNRNFGRNDNYGRKRHYRDLDETSESYHTDGRAGNSRNQPSDQPFVKPEVPAVSNLAPAVSNPAPVVVKNEPYVDGLKNYLQILGTEYSSP
ncbi:HIT zinc finger domain-containing protein [Ditylenchus destructor]|uniref:HIT zinc finger domain-containing protein n=1 Tax=Ditylenchus destructor TaxID=166010 RepID=A0AAD4NE25_9BILA|nr:HIT zinc finger domain-containing protein [Ditylenchus destructor]